MNARQWIGLGAALGGIGVVVPAMAQMMAPPGVVVAPAPYCQGYTDKFTMNGETRITHGVACLQPDGSWELRPTDAPVHYAVRNGLTFLVPLAPFRHHEERHEERERHHEHDHYR